MKKFIATLFTVIFISNYTIAENTESSVNNLFHIGQMNSHDKRFTLFFKTRDKAVLARGENYNYITDFPQDLYILHNGTNNIKPLITYDWFPKAVKKLSTASYLPVFPEDYAYYLLSDNETLIMISGVKSIRSNFKFSLKTNKLEKLPLNNKYKLFVSSLLKDCGYKNMNSTYKCLYYKPLISKNLIN